MKIFSPAIRQPSPVSDARHRMRDRSEPAPGSVTATAEIFSPEVIDGIQRAFCSGVPAFSRCGDAMSVCTRTVAEKPPKVERPTSSASMTLDIQEVHAFAADDEEVSLMNPQITVAADARVLLAGTKDDDNRGGPPVASGTVRLTIAGAGSALKSG